MLAGAERESVPLNVSNIPSISAGSGGGAVGLGDAGMESVPFSMPFNVSNIPSISGGGGGGAVGLGSSGSDAPRINSLGAGGGGMVLLL